MLMTVLMLWMVVMINVIVIPIEKASMIFSNKQSHHYIIMNLIEMKLNLKSENQMCTNVARCVLGGCARVRMALFACVLCVAHRFLVFARQIYIIMKSWKYHCYFRFYFHFIIDSRKSSSGWSFCMRFTCFVFFNCCSCVCMCALKLLVPAETSTCSMLVHETSKQANSKYPPLNGGKDWQQQIKVTLGKSFELPFDMLVSLCFLFLSLLRRTTAFFKSTLRPHFPSTQCRSFSLNLSGSFSLLFYYEVNIFTYTSWEMSFGKKYIKRILCVWVCARNK